jgi:hypothetical protein
MQVCPNCGLPLAVSESAPDLAESAPILATSPTKPQPPNNPAYGATPPHTNSFHLGAEWQPGSRPVRLWARVVAGGVAACAVIALVLGVYYQTRVQPVAARIAATATATHVASTTLLSDSLLTANVGWTDDSSCYHDHDGYHIVDGYICYAPIGIQTDGTESVTVKQVSGNTVFPYGLVFRTVSTGNRYFAGVDSNSYWVFDKVVNGKATRLKEIYADPIIKGGLNTENTLSVTMTGSTFDCYINGQKVATIHDSTFAEGKWGLEGNDEINVVFTNYLAQR